MIVKKSESIWTRTFLLLCSAQFLGYAQHAVLTPVLPLYVTHLGGSAFIVGLVLATFAATSVVVRPLVGHWADRWNEAGVMVSGLLFQGISIFFCFIPFVSATMLANGLRGIGWAGLNTGGYSLLALTARNLAAARLPVFIAVFKVPPPFCSPPSRSGCSKFCPTVSPPCS